MDNYSCIEFVCAWYVHAILYALNDIHKPAVFAAYRKLESSLHLASRDRGIEGGDMAGHTDVAGSRHSGIKA